MGLQKSLIVILLLFVSCGIKKKSVTKKEKVTEITREVISKLDRIITDSTITFLNIETLNIVSRDSTQPIRIIDSKGSTKTFYNVLSITTTKDRSIIRKALKDSKSSIITSTVGETTKVSESTKNKFKVDTTIIYVFIGIILIIFIIRLYRKYFIVF